MNYAQFPNTHAHEPEKVKEKKVKGYPQANPHQISRSEEFSSQIPKKKRKPDPATVEAELQREEDLWNS
jgi:hypothetical protein